MHLLIVGINTNKVNRPSSEQLVLSKGAYEKALNKLNQLFPDDEFFLLDSSEIKEVYVYVNPWEKRKNDLQSFLSDLFDLQSLGKRLHFYSHEHQDAVIHFLKVASGLESSVLGDTEIFERFRNCFQYVLDRNYAGASLNKLFQTAIKLNRRIHQETDFYSSAVTSGIAVIEIIKKIYDDYPSKAVLVIGTGFPIEQAVKSLAANDVKNISFSGRDVKDVEHIANIFNGRIVASENVIDNLANCDIVLCSEDFGNTKFTEKTLSEVMHQRHNSPLLIVDFNRAGTVKGDLSQVYNLFLYTPQDLEKIKHLNLKVRSKEIPRIEKLIDEELRSYFQWFYSKERYRFGKIIGKNHKMQKVLELIARISQTDITVLIDGESGTGKELIAKAIHENSPRSNKPFITVNCGALTETLLESELFGHVKGSFTGATSNKKGLFEVAHQGTIFLDEIGDTSPAIQVKLLRVLQEGDIKPVGSSNIIKVDVRLITATNKNLEKLVEEGTFRKDLFYRLNVVQITLPPLRDRMQDIPLLADHFIQKFSKNMNKKNISLSDEVMDQLKSYYWPGNVRELENAIERAVALAIGQKITLADLPHSIQDFDKKKSPLIEKGPGKGMTLKELERKYILDTLEKYSWDYDLVAKKLNIGRTTLWRRLKAYQLEGEQKKRENLH